MSLPEWVPWWAYLVGSAVLVALWRKSSPGATGGTGKVVGIVGRMGSGKSYFAVRMAYRRMMRGANVRTNFTMRLSPLHETSCPPKCERKKRCKCVRHCPCQIAGRWAPFHGWEQIAELENAVVIIDEADLYAPSLDPRAIPDIARWKMKMARKYKLDIYWLTQHESMVNRHLRESLSNYIFVCSSWFNGLFFTAKGYEPHQVRRHRKHLERKAYRFQQRIADLYDTLQVIQGDAMVNRDGTMKRANELAAEYNAKRAKGSPKASIAEIARVLREDVGRAGERCGEPKKNGEPCQLPARALYGGKCHLHGERASA